MSKFDCTVVEQTTLDIPEHEILLSFTNDCGAEAFQDWWEDEGEEVFREWALENKEAYFE